MDISLKQDKEYDIDFLGDIIPGPEPILNKDYPIIPVCEPDLDGNAKKYVNEALDTNWVSSRGKYLELFEKAFAKKVGAKYAATTTSGTNALYLVLASLDLHPGDEIIVPTFTMISTVFAVTYLGCIPIFVDCDEYYQMDVEAVKRVISTRTKVILPVHIYGHPVDMDSLEALGIPVIYDACEAHGALYKDQPIGGRGVASCYSFYANKILTTGEGGMITSNNKKLIEIARTLKNVSFSEERHFWHKKIGYNFHMTNLCAAIGLAQTERFDELVGKHIANAKYYRERLRDIPGLKFAKEAPWAKNVYWMFGIEVEEEFGMTRDQLRKYLADHGVETRTYFVPMHLQPYYYRGETGFPNAERLSKNGMYLPSSSTLKEEEMDVVISLIHQASAIGRQDV